MSLEEEQVQQTAALSASIEQQILAKFNQMWQEMVTTQAACSQQAKYPLPFFVCYVHPVTQQYESRTVRKACL